MDEFKRLLQDPQTVILGAQGSFVKNCVFGNDPQKLTSWLQHIAWVKFPMYRAELYALHRTFHNQQPLDVKQYVFVTHICTQNEILAPIAQIYSKTIPHPANESC
jgi:hypothetical protein